jgi:hypothetical protein
MSLDPAHSVTLAVSWTGTDVKVELFVGEVTVIWARALVPEMARPAAHTSAARMGDLYCMDCVLSEVQVRVRCRKDGVELPRK